MLLELRWGACSLVLLSLPPEYSQGENIMYELQRQPEMKVQTDSLCLQPDEMNQ